VKIEILLLEKKSDSKKKQCDFVEPKGTPRTIMNTLSSFLLAVARTFLPNLNISYIFFLAGVEERGRRVCLGEWQKERCDVRCGFPPSLSSWAFSWGG